MADNTVTVGLLLRLEAALVSLPALGVLRRRAHAREAIVRFVGEVLGDRVGPGREDGARDGDGPKSRRPPSGTPREVSLIVS